MEKKADDPAGFCLDVSCRNSTGFVRLSAERQMLPTKDLSRQKVPPGATQLVICWKRGELPDGVRHLHPFYLPTNLQLRETTDRVFSNAIKSEKIGLSFSNVPNSQTQSQVSKTHQKVHNHDEQAVFDILL